VEELLTSKQAAAYAKVSVRSLKRWRAEGTGPKFLKAGRQVRYRKRDLDEWMERRAEG
jgi:excisionase family DNA binding protein